MKLEQRKTYLMALFSFVSIALMLVIVSPTYVQADNNRILDGDNAIAWLKYNHYIEGDIYYIDGIPNYKTRPEFKTFDKLMYSDPTSPDGLKGVDWYSKTPRETYPKLINNIVINVDWQTYRKYEGSKNPQNPSPPSFTPLNPQPIGATKCSSSGSPGPHGSIQNGLVCHYYSNGQLNYERQYQNGVLHGISNKYLRSGHPETLKVYRNGRIVKLRNYSRMHPGTLRYCWYYGADGSKTSCMP